jgi:hypothetical protein
MYASWEAIGVEKFPFGHVTAHPLVYQQANADVGA